MQQQQQQNTDEREEGAGILEIPLTNITTAVLKKVVEFCEILLTEEPMVEITEPILSNNLAEIVPYVYARFINSIDQQDMIFDLMLAANFMDIKPLLTLTSVTVATLMFDKTAEEVRATLDLSNDFSPEEEQQLIRENRWDETV
jgi:S-phase kinase-associated protein 1